MVNTGGYFRIDVDLKTEPEELKTVLSLVGEALKNFSTNLFEKYGFKKRDLVGKIKMTFVLDDKEKKENVRNDEE